MADTTEATARTLQASPGTAAMAPVPLRTFRSLFAYLALLTGLLPPSAHAELLGAPLVLVAVLAGWRDLRRVSRVLVLMVGASGLAAWLWAPQLLVSASANTTHLTALVVAVLLLSATLGSSRDLSVLSGSLFAGRPLPRYLGISFATGFLAVPLNFGSVGVMGTVVARVKQLRGDSSLTRNAARAVLRGFALASICSPLSISVVITLTFMHGIGLHQLIAVSLPFAALYLLLGSVFREPESLPANGDPVLSDAVASAPALLPWLRFTAYIAAICLGAWALSSFAQMRYSRAVALSCVCAVALGWLMQRLRSEPTGLPCMAQVSNELAVMCGSAFLGVLAGGTGLYLLGLDFGLPVWISPLVAFGVPWLLFLAGMAGLNPIVTGTLIGAMLSPIWPQSALLGLAFGMVCGWGLTVAGTPYSANAMLLSRITGYDAHTAALQWNLRLSLWSLGLAGLLAASLTHWLTAAP
jgi:hypothetical protein